MTQSQQNEISPESHEMTHCSKYAMKRDFIKDAL